MTSSNIRNSASWCIVVADDYGPQGLGRRRSEIDCAPVHYRHLGAAGTLLQRALHRAASIAPASQILLTADEECRELWEASMWLVRPFRRFVGATRHTARLTAAAAALYVAQKSPSALVTILPARCWVAHEASLRRGLAQALEELPGIEERVVTLGMLDLEDPSDENYLTLGRAGAGEAPLVQSLARRPTAVAARQLRRRGALVASDIIIGYAGALAAALARHWPGALCAKLGELVAQSAEECEVPLELLRELPRGVFYSHPWHPAAVPQRAIAVCRSGWSGLKSPRSIERVLAFVAATAAVQAGKPMRLEPTSMASLIRTRSRAHDSHAF